MCFWFVQCTILRFHSKSNIHAPVKKSLKIPNGLSETIYRRTDNAVAKRKKVQKDQQLSTKHTYKTKYRKMNPTKTGRLDVTELLLKVALNTKNQNQIRGLYLYSVVHRACSKNRNPHKHNF